MHLLLLLALGGFELLRLLCQLGDSLRIGEHHDALFDVQVTLLQGQLAGALRRRKIAQEGPEAVEPFGQLRVRDVGLVASHRLHVVRE